jgi:hypothetical protein
LAVGVLASTTYNNFIADLLFLSEVSHSLLVAGPPCVHPYLGKWALLATRCCDLRLGLRSSVFGLRSADRGPDEDGGRAPTRLDRLPARALSRRP